MAVKPRAVPLPAPPSYRPPVANPVSRITSPFIPSPSPRPIANPVPVTGRFNATVNAPQPIGLPLHAVRGLFS